MERERPWTMRALRLLVVVLLAGFCFQSGFQFGVYRGLTHEAHRSENSVEQLKRFYKNVYTDQATAAAYEPAVDPLAAGDLWADLTGS